MAKDKSESIDVVGLKEFQRELRAMDKSFPRELRLANKKAAEPVAAEARSSFAGRGGVAPKVAPSVKVQAQQREASISIGGDKYPYALGAEFGGGLYRKGNPTPAGGYTTQFEPHSGRDGYSLFPAVRRNRQNIIDAYGDLIDEVAKSVFPN